MIKITGFGDHDPGLSDQDRRIKRSRSAGLGDQDGPEYALKSLQVLDIDNTAVSDRGISQLRDHPNLQILWVEGCEMSDKCVPALLTFERLAYVSLMDTLVSTSGFDQLEAKGVEVHA